MKAIKVAAAVILKDGEALIARRAEGQKFAGYWEFPGGKIEPYETPQECAEREIFEELGIRISAGPAFSETVHTYEDVEIEMIAVRAELRGGTIVLTVHDAVELVPLENLSRYRFAPADLPIVEKLQSPSEK